VQINPRKTAKDLVKMLEETGTKARLRVAMAHGDKVCTFWRNVHWSDEIKIEVFGHNVHRYVWRKKRVRARRPTNLTPLHQLCQEKWAKIHPTYCGKLVECYPKHLTQVKHFKGNATKY
jgi:hypothetical protein